MKFAAIIFALGLVIFARPTHAAFELRCGTWTGGPSWLNLIIEEDSVLVSLKDQNYAATSEEDASRVRKNLRIVSDLSNQVYSVKFDDKHSYWFISLNLNAKPGTVKTTTGAQSDIGHVYVKDFFRRPASDEVSPIPGFKHSFVGIYDITVGRVNNPTKIETVRGEANCEIGEW